ATEPGRAPARAPVAAAHDPRAAHRGDADRARRRRRAAPARPRVAPPHPAARLVAMHELGTMRVKGGLAEMLKGGVIMDVVDAEQAKVAEEGGECAAVALERLHDD